MLVFILAIETSCDETSVAVVKDGTEILSNVVASQVEFHRKYGGVVPEIASRKHVEVLNILIKQAMDEAKVKFSDLDAVAVTYGPGLVGALLVGICAAKAIAYSQDIPLVGVNHIEGHIYANFLKSPAPNFPFLSLIVSGGHTMLVLVKDHCEYETLGRTRDDAAGEAFDKIARFLGLGFPGGPIIDEISKKGDPKAIEFPRAMLEEGYDFSFSGLKTAVINYVKKFGKENVADIAASFQQAVVDVLVEKAIKAAKERKVGTIALAGGVCANSALRNSLKERAAREGLEVSTPPIYLCTDNAAMIAAAGYQRLRLKNTVGFDLTAVSTLKL
ncbi:MAG: tRNA (adenosine(37)-N6)-threonylcarbamoyltransferase complex transferase subunit TsaD [Candidatus Saganbacteria bacterium]|nr:tRNA (adenosine(37)-N6)-threonylcarbamoyltransferase complex transferase subunit TsaD [Candidatus Saganbacteria bacterium]